MPITKIVTDNKSSSQIFPFLFYKIIVIFSSTIWSPWSKSKSILAIAVRKTKISPMNYHFVGHKCLFSTLSVQFSKNEGTIWFYTILCGNNTTQK